MLRLTDTRTRQLEPVEPAADGVLRVYACGPTVYRPSHVGNLRTFLLADVLRRVAEGAGMQVRLVQNITDVGHLADDSGVDLTGEDKILAQARLEDLTPLQVARRYEEMFHADQAALGNRPAAAYPRATEWIDSMLALVQRLVDGGHAYTGTDGSVYFDARSFPGYGEVSGNRIEDLRAGHREDAETLTAAKRFHADWALWKAGPEGAVADPPNMLWDSPWGVGFPGWHLECSAMSLELLGERIDVHLGGIDLRFPHHEDERAQTDAAVGHEVVQRWVHGEHLLFEGRKMAKSTGNVVLVSDVVDRGIDPLALRLAFLEQRYRTQANLSWASIEAADKLLTRWRELAAEWAAAGPADPAAAQVRVQGFVAACEDDLDVPEALRLLRRMVSEDGATAAEKLAVFEAAEPYLGIDLLRLVGAAAPELPDGAADLLEARAAARAGKDYAASDALRDQLAALGVAVTDTPDGQTWRPAGR